MNPSRPGGLTSGGIRAAADGLAMMVSSLQEIGGDEAMLKLRAEGPSKSGYRNPPKNRGNRWKRQNRKKLHHLRGRW